MYAHRWTHKKSSNHIDFSSRDSPLRTQKKRTIEGQPLRDLHLNRMMISRRFTAIYNVLLVSNTNKSFYVFAVFCPTIVINAPIEYYWFQRNLIFHWIFQLLHTFHVQWMLQLNGLNRDSAEPSTYPYPAINKFSTPKTYEGKLDGLSALLTTAFLEVASTSWVTTRWLVVHFDNSSTQCIHPKMAHVSCTATCTKAT